MTEECKHPIFSYMGADYWHGSDKRVQRHQCIDCGHEEQDVPDGSVMIGHAPGECDTCDRFAASLPDNERQRWTRLNEEQRQFP